jgi:hypothetical protein
VIALFENRLATYKHPRDVIFLKALPRNWYGKVDRSRLHDLVARAQEKPRRPSPVGPSAPGPQTVRRDRPDQPSHDRN